MRTVALQRVDQRHLVVVKAAIASNPAGRPCDVVIESALLKPPASRFAVSIGRAIRVQNGSDASGHHAVHEIRNA